jgi:hypothetical protein
LWFAWKRREEKFLEGFGRKTEIKEKPSEDLSVDGKQY